MKKTLVYILFISIFNIVQAQDWQTDINRAKSIAQKENKKIVTVFSGSDWCAPCIRMDRKYWTNPDFIAYAKKHFVMLRVDFPRRKKNKLSEEQMKKNYAMVEKYNPDNYFPFVVVLDAEGNVLGQNGFKKIPVPEFIKLLESYNYK